MKNKFTIFGFFAKELKKNWLPFVFLVCSVIGIALASIMPSLVLKRIIDNLLDPIESVASAKVQNLIFWTFLYFLGYFLMYGFTILENYLVDNLGQKMIHSIRYGMMEKSHHLKSGIFRHNGTGVMTSRVMDDVLSIENLFTDGLVSLMVSLFKILSVFVSVFVFSWLLGVVLLICTPIVFATTNFFKKRLLQHQLKSRKISNMETNNVSESIDNIEVLMNLEKKKYREDQFIELLEKEKGEKKKTSYFDATFSPIVMSLRALVISVVTFIVASTILHSTTVAGLSAGTFAASITLISNIFSPIQELGQEIQTMQEGISGIKRVEDYMNIEEENKKNPAYTSSLILSNKNEKDIIRFKDVSFHYDDGDEMIYDHADLSIGTYDKVSLIGRTGVGKTTLFYLLLSILTPTGGMIEVNGFDVSKIPNEEKRKIFGYVQQGFEPVEGTIIDQVTLRDKSVSIDLVHKVMREVFLDDYVMNKNKEGYEATFREEDFSRGQLQLLSLARALVFDPPILLLDEISANLDSETEKNLITALENVGRKKTILTISHRLSDQLGFRTVVEVKDGKLIRKD